MRERNKNTPTPPRYAFRLEDLREWHRVEAACFKCNRTVELRHAMLKRGRTPHTRLKDLEGKLRCSRCGKLGTLTVSVIPRD